jgi:hypothetical protein
MIGFRMGQIVLDGPVADLSPIHLEVAFAEHLAGGEAVGSRRFTAESFGQKGVHFDGPVGRVIAARNTRGPGGLLMKSTGLEVIAIDFIETGSAKAQLLEGGFGLEFSVAKQSQHMAHQWKATAIGQLEFLRFSSGESTRTEGLCPPDPLGFFALCLLQQGAEQSRRTVAGPPDPNLAVRKPPDRRSGRIPALPYPPLEHPKIINPQLENKGAKQKSAFARTSAFASYKLFAFANYSCSLLLAPRHSFPLGGETGSHLANTQKSEGQHLPGRPFCR